MFKRNNTYLNYKICLFSLDIIIIFLSFYLSLVLNKYTITENYGYVIIIYLISFVLFVYFDNYKYKSLKLIGGYLLSNVVINIIIFGLIAVAIFITPLGGKMKFINIFKFYFLFYFAGIIFIRILFFEIIFRNLNKIRSFNRNAIILGVSKDSENLYENKEDIKLNNGLNIIGFIKIKKVFANFKYESSVLGGLSDILELSKKHSFKDVFILSDDIETNELINMIEFLRSNGFMVRVYEKNLSSLINANLHDIYGNNYKFVDFSTNRIYYKKTLKPFFDYLFGIIFLILISPLLLVIAILVKLTSVGPAFFVAERIGFNEKIFKIFKFRSMRNDPDNNTEAHKENIKSFYLGREEGDIKKQNVSDKVTKTGRFLRKHSLDEIPQFINILTGDMSIIGPRPCTDYEHGYFNGWKKNRFKVKPGITGLWQVYGRSKVNFEDLSVLDYFYYTNCSFMLDLRIAFDTIKVLIMGIGGY